MSSSNFSTSGQLPVPLIIPVTQAAVPTTSGSSFNIFRMIINDGQRAKLKQPIVDLESEDLSEAQEAVAKSPVAKRRKEESKTDEVSNMASTDHSDHAAKSSQSANELSLITRSEVGDVIDLTSESVSPCSTIVEASDYEDDVVWLNDLTVLDEEVSILEDAVVGKRRTRSRRSMGIRLSICADMERKPSEEDALSRAAAKTNGESSRLWEKFPAVPPSSSRNTVVRICSYNVLCQLKALKTMFLYRHLRSDDSPLKWENRWPILEKELLRLNADVFGLQEVQCDHFDSYFKPSMSKAGYATYYKPQTGMTGDGCAVLVRKSKLEVVNYRVVEYFVGLGTSMDKDQIGQILRIRCRETHQEFIFANTHLLFNSARGDIKLGQLAMLIANIEDELTKSRCPVILCGDLNIEPFSYVYTYISESSVYLRGLPRNELSGQGRFGGPYVVAENILPPMANIGRDSMFINKEAVHRQAVSADYFTHPLRLASVYHHFSVNGEKEISTYHRDMANPDFLFYSIEKKVTADSRTHVYEVPELRLLRRLSLPDFTTLRKTCGPWPNRYVPSDHIPLVADFILSKIDRV